MKEIATQAFCYLLNFIQEHNPHLVRKISVPLFTNVSSTMVLANHTLRQLNIIDDSNMYSKSSGHLSSVLSFLNRSCTSMGKRNFKYQLLNHTCDIDTLNDEYSLIDYILLKNDSYIPQVRKILLNIRDIDKINRQIVSNKLNPATLHSLFKTVETIQELNSTYIVGDIVLNDYIQLKCVQKNDNVEFVTTDFISFINSKFDIQSCQYLNSTLLFDKNIIKSNVSPQFDSLIYKETHTNDNITIIQTFFNDLMKTNDKPSNKELEYIKIHETDKTGISFHITKKTFYNS